MKKMTIHELILDIGEDKHSNFTTTSDKFKIDLWNFFKDYGNFNCLELGTHKGQTTRILSKLFKHVVTVNKNVESLQYAIDHNGGFDNITYTPYDLYGGSVQLITELPLSAAFIDAGHSKEQVISDINRVIHMNIEKDFYIIFDDFGMHTPVYDAINIYLDNGVLEYITDIGQSIGYNFGGDPPRVLNNGAEGIICKLKHDDE